MTQPIKTPEQLKRISAARSAYYEALANSETAWKAYQISVDDFYSGAITRPQLDQVLQAANLADCVKSDAYAAWGKAQSSEDEECTCRPNSTILCPACRKSQAVEIDF